MVLFLTVLSLSAMAQTRVIAHRGYWDTLGSSQNSLAGLYKGDSISVYAVEFDVWLTNDGGLVVNHDKIFKGVDIPNSSTLEACSITLDNGEKLPTLNEFLSFAQRFPNLRLVLELKSDGNCDREKEAIKKIIQALEYFKCTSKTDFISFSLHACKEFHKMAPQIPVYYLNGELSPSEILSLGFCGIDYSGKVLAAHSEWIKQAHELGLLVNVWTIDQEKDMRKLVEQGVDFITTNKPLLLQTIVEGSKSDSEN